MRMAGPLRFAKYRASLSCEGSMTFPVSDHFNGKTFSNPGAQTDRSWRDLLRWKLHSQAAPWPRRVEIAPQRPAVPGAGEVVATWINHSTFLLQTPHGSVITDPIFSERCSPLSWAGPRRVHPPGVRFGEPPRLDAVLLSHDHYDHCDLPTLRQLARREPQPRFIAPLGHAELARTAGFRAESIIELDWWQAQTVTPGLEAILTPAQHWSKRLGRPRNSRLWGGFFLKTAGTPAVHFVGDSGYHDSLFCEIRARLGPPGLALVPIGAYEPRWFMAPQHCNPAEAVQIHRDLGASVSVAMHWGTFQLTDEGRDEPPRALAAAQAAAGLDTGTFRVLAPGESLRMQLSDIVARQPMADDARKL
jgi:L-ascorbate metabolism protein UlaG (beta-lactamase superfamily)